MTEFILERLVKIIDTKRSVLCFSADLNDPWEILAAANILSPHIVAIKLHVDCIDFRTHMEMDAFLLALQVLAKPEHGNFLIMIDYKICDIGKIAQRQFNNVAEYADLITVHGISGPGVVDAMRPVAEQYNCALLLIAEMSSRDNLITPEYTERMIQMAVQNTDIVLGFIAQNLLKHSQKFHETIGTNELVIFTPGIKLPEPKSLDSKFKDLKPKSLNLESKDDQQYNTPEIAKTKGTDIMIVGSGIYNSHDMVATAKKYNEAYFAD